MNKVHFDKLLRRINDSGDQKKPKFESETFRTLSEYLKFIVNLTETKSTTFNVEYDFHGVKKPLNIINDSSLVFNNLFLNLKEHPPISIGKEYLATTRSFLDKNKAPSILKAQLIIAEIKFIDELLKHYLRNSETGIANINIRIEIISLFLAKKIEQEILSEIELTNSYSFLINEIKDAFTLKGQLIQCLNYLEDRLLAENSSIEKSLLIKSLVNYSTSYNLLSRRALEERVSEFEDYLDKEELELIKAEINTDTRNANVFSLKISSGVLSLQNSQGKEFSTIIRFSIPIEYSYGKPVTIDNDEGKPRILIDPIQTFWVDPMFTAFMNLKIGNIGWSHFSDLSVESEGVFCHVVVVIKGLYAPDIKLLETSYESVDYSEKEQIEGRKYFPHKELAIKVLIDAFEELKKVMLIKSKNEISANLFSNFIVEYVENETNIPIKSVLYALTCHDSFSKTRSKFLEKLASRNLSDKYTSIRSLLRETSIESERNLREFVERTIILIVKNNIEHEGGYDYFWTEASNGEKLPNKEPKLQPYVLGHLKIIYEYMGIQISREVISANGEIDFLVTFNNSRSELLRVCVELKLAHNAKLDDGINKQLKKYMSAERSKQGVFVVLWFKCKKAPYIFNNPTDYQNLEQLEKKLTSINTDRNIAIITIDCSKPTTPSKL